MQIYCMHPDRNHQSPLIFSLDFKWICRCFVFLCKVTKENILWITVISWMHLLYLSTYEVLKLRSNIQRHIYRHTHSSKKLRFKVLYNDLYFISCSLTYWTSDLEPPHPCFAHFLCAHVSTNMGLSVPLCVYLWKTIGNKRASSCALSSLDKNGKTWTH